MKSEFIPAWLNRTLNFAMVIVTMSVTIFLWLADSFKPAPPPEEAPPQEQEVIERKVNEQRAELTRKTEQEKDNIAHTNRPLIVGFQFPAQSTAADATVFEKQPLTAPLAEEPAKKDVEASQADKKPPEPPKDPDENKQEPQADAPKSDLDSLAAAGDEETKFDGDEGAAANDAGVFVPSYLFDSLEDYLVFAKFHHGKFFAITADRTKAYLIGSALKAKHQAYSVFAKGQLDEYSIRRAGLKDSPAIQEIIEDVARQNGAQADQLSIFMLLPVAADNQLAARQVAYLKNHDIPPRKGLLTKGTVVERLGQIEYEISGVFENAVSDQPITE